MKRPFRQPRGSKGGKPKVYILPTRYGAVFLFVLAAMLIGSINYNNNLGFLLTFLLGSMAMVSMFHTHSSVAGIRVEEVKTTPVFAGKTAVFQIRLRKEGPPSNSLHLSFDKGGDGVSDIAADASSVFHVTAPATGRGLFNPGPLTASSRYPFDLFRSWTVLSAPASCLVYPEPLAGADELVTVNEREAAFGSTSGKGVEDFAGLRTYQPGDNLQQISWKAYSKGQGLMTKQFSGDAGSVRYADWFAINEPDTERRLSRLCALLLRAHRENRGFGLRLPGRIIEAGDGASHLHECLKALALFGISTEAGRVRGKA